MALYKGLLVTALIAIALALPVPSAALPVDCSAVSALADAPGLAALVRATRACSYFKCGTQKVKAVVKHTYTCWFKVATSTRSRRASFAQCSLTPYACVDDAKCTGWKQCKCDVCTTVKVTTAEYCVQPPK